MHSTPLIAFDQHAATTVAAFFAGAPDAGAPLAQVGDSDDSPVRQPDYAPRRRAVLLRGGPLSLANSQCAANLPQQACLAVIPPSLHRQMTTGNATAFKRSTPPNRTCPAPTGTPLTPLSAFDTVHDSAAAIDTNGDSRRAQPVSARCGRASVQPRMRSVPVVQVDNATPIVLSLDKFVIRGIHGSVGLSRCTRH